MPSSSSPPPPPHGPCAHATVYMNSVRQRIRRGWHVLREAVQRRTAVFRVAGLVQRSRSRFMRLAFGRWRVAAADSRAKQARTEARRLALASCLHAARRREARAVWAAWSDLVAQQRRGEDGLVRRARLSRFAASLARVGARRESTLKRRALVSWRIGAAHAAVVVARKEAAATADLVRAAEGEKVSCLPGGVSGEERASRLLRSTVSGPSTVSRGRVRVDGSIGLRVYSLRPVVDSKTGGQAEEISPMRQLPRKTSVPSWRGPVVREQRASRPETTETRSENSREDITNDRLFPDVPDQVVASKG